MAQEPPIPSADEAVTLFYSYAEKDESFLEELEKHLTLLRRQGLLSDWHKQRIQPGTNWSQEIDEHLNSADVILLLISPDFLASDYYYDGEMTHAMERYNAGEALVIPILLRYVEWQSAPFAALQVLPSNNKPITDWPDQDKAFADVAASIRSALKNLSLLPRAIHTSGVNPPLSESTTQQRTGQKRTLRLWLSVSDDAEGKLERAAISLIREMAPEIGARQKAVLDIVNWNDPATGLSLLARQTPMDLIQSGLPAPSSCDIVVMILWTRMVGANKPLEYEGRSYESSTTFEYYNAIEANSKNNGIPRLIVYYCSTEPQVPNIYRLSDAQRRLLIDGAMQYERLQNFISELRASEVQNNLTAFTSTTDFQRKFRKDLPMLITEAIATKSRQLPAAASTPTQPTIDIPMVLQHYLRWVISEHQQLDVRGLRASKDHPHTPLQIELEKVYVALKGDRSNSYERLQARALLEMRALELLLNNHNFSYTSGPSLGLSELVAMLEDNRQDVLLQFPISPSLEENERAEENRGETSENIITLAEAFQQERRLVILGDPGSGKTTLTRWLALKLATGLLANGEQPIIVKAQDISPVVQEQDQFENLGPARLPILLRVSDFAEYLKAHPGENISLMNFLAHHKWSKDPEEFDPILTPTALGVLFETYITSGKAVVMLDGMDEVTTQKLREQVVKTIERFITSRSFDSSGNDKTRLKAPPVSSGGNQIVITSRKAGYDDSPIKGNLMHVTVARMELPAIERFCHAWMQAIYAKMGRTGENSTTDPIPEATALAKELFSTICEPKHSAIRELASNPLLVTMLAEIFVQDRMLPQQRVDLYRRTLENLIFDWTRETRNTSETGRGLRDDEIYYVLAPLAAYIHEHYSNGLIHVKEMRAELRKSLLQLRKERPGTSLPFIDADIEDFLFIIRDRMGIITERGAEKYGFIHLTFQEYLAAVYLVHRSYHDYQTSVHLLLNKMTKPRWAEIVRLALGYITIVWSEEERDILIEDLLTREQRDPIERAVPRSRLLLAQAISDMRTLPESVVRRLTSQLLQRYADLAVHQYAPTLAKQLETALEGIRQVYPLIVDSVLENALIRPASEQRDMRYGAAKLIHIRSWYTLRLANALQKALPYDSPAWNFPVDLALLDIVTPPLTIPILDPPALPDAKLRELREQLRRIEIQETDSWLTLEEIQEEIQKEQAAMPQNRVRYFYLQREYTQSLQDMARQPDDTRARKHLPLYQLHLRRELARESDGTTLQFIQHDVAWTRLILALYGGSYNYERDKIDQEYYQIATYLQMEGDERDPFEEIYKKKFGTIDPVYWMATYLDNGMDRRKKNWGAKDNLILRLDALYREPDLAITNLIKLALTHRQSTAKLKEELWNIWRQQRNSAEMRADALTGLGALGERILPVLQEALTKAPDKRAAELSIECFARLHNALHDPVAREPALPKLLSLRALEKKSAPPTSELIDSLAAMTEVAVKMGAKVVNWEYQLFGQSDDELASYLLAESMAGWMSGVADDFAYHVAGAIEEYQEQQEPVIPLISALSSLQRARNLQAPLHQGWLVEQLAPLILRRDDLPWQLFTALETITNHVGFIRSNIFQSLQPYIAQHPEWLPEILACNLSDTYRYADAFAPGPKQFFDAYTIALQLDPSLQKSANYLEAIREKALNLPSPYHRARALLRLVRYFPETRADMLNKIQQDTFAISDVELRVSVAERLLPFLSQERRKPVLSETISSARKIPKASNRALALARLVFHVAPAERQHLLKEALEALKGIKQAHLQAEGLRMLLPLFLLYGLKEQAQMIITRLPSPTLQALAQDELMPQVLHSQTITGGEQTQQMEWAVFGLAALALDVKQTFDTSSQVDRIWMRLKTTEQETALEELLAYAASGGIPLTCVGALVLDELWVAGDRKTVTALLPLLHQPVPDVVPLLEKWMHDEDILLNDVAALLLADLQGVTDRSFFQIVHLRESNNNHLRNRASFALNTSGRHIRASQLGYKAINALYTMLETYAETNVGIGLTLKWTVQNILHDDQQMINRWISVLAHNESDHPEAKIAFSALGNIQRVELPVWTTMMVGLDKGSTLTQMALLRSVCILAYKKNQLHDFMWNMVKPLIQKVAQRALAHDKKWMMIAAFPQDLLEPIEVGLQHLQTHEREYDRAIEKSIEKLHENSFNIYEVLAANPEPDLAFVKTVGSYPFWGSKDNEKVLEISTRLEAQEKSLSLVTEWLTLMLSQDMQDKSSNEYNDSRLILLKIAAELTARQPGAFASSANPAYLESLLVEAVITHNTFPGRVAALKLLSFLRTTTEEIGRALRAAVKDVYIVRAGVFETAPRLHNVKLSILPQLIKGLYDEDSMVVYVTIQLLEAIGRNDKTEDEGRLLILEALTQAALDPSSKRVVEPAYTPMKILPMPTLRDKIYQAILQVSGLS